MPLHKKILWALVPIGFLLMLTPLILPQRLITLSLILVGTAWVILQLTWIVDLIAQRRRYKRWLEIEEQKGIVPEFEKTLYKCGLY